MVHNKTLSSLNTLFCELFLKFHKDKFDPKIHRGHIRITPEDIGEKDQFVLLYGPYYQNYNQVLANLRQEPSLEFLRDKELDELLWNLTCEIILYRSKYKFEDIKKEG